MKASLIAILVCVLLNGDLIFSQGRRPASPAGSSATQVGGRHDEREGYVGGRWITVQYGRPIKRGRDLFGPSDFAEALYDGAPVWRAGANVSTRLNTEVPLEIGGTIVAPGEYSVFIELHRDSWTLILSTWPAQTTYDDTNKAALWGAYDYTPDRDVVRTTMKLETLAHSFDQLAWEFLDMSDTGGTLALLWDKTLASVPFRVGG
ncbi:MAG: DUF2911 domain-containing protein [Luteitalea sp.]|nr:DUF2911 domain-containing protein [Luteitalea sp.]